jgi:serine/threonine-protein kinase
MSRLFLATEVSLHRQVVIKLLPPEFASEVSATRFRQEIEVAAHLQHTNILPVLTAGAKDDLLFYVMPFVSGESLRHRLTREGKLSVTDAVRILHEIADALAHAHAEGVIHRDIKPENILLLGSHAVLTDFGVARALAESRSGGRLTDTGFALGTPGYMSPEQAAGERNVDARADVYALAVVGYEMLAGFPPFAGPTAQAVIAAHLTATPKPLTDARPETPPAVANAIARALAKDPNARLRTAAEFRDSISAAFAPPAQRFLSNRVRVAAGLAVFAVLVVAGVLGLRSRAPGTLDPNVVAVAPFEVLDPKLELWREGLVDVLSRKLDGAGSLRTVSPTVVVRRWSGRADPAAASELGRRTGAGLVVFGTVTAEGRDSVRVAAAVAETPSGRVLAEVQQRDATDRLDRLVDSLTVALLRKIGGPVASSMARLGSVGTSSLAALKAFLQGEQYYRRTAWDSALAAYRRAVQTDSGFAVAWHRMGEVVGWRVVGGDSLSRIYALRGAALNRGLAPRDSVLIQADSLMEALFTGSDDTAWREHHARLFATLNEAARRYPEDPDVWYELGDANVHFRLVGRTTRERTLGFFDRSIALDSSMGRTYIHPIGLAVELGHPEQALRYIEAYLRLAPNDVTGSAIHLADAILRSAPGVDRAIDTASADVLFSAWFHAAAWPDSNETAVRLGRALVASRRSVVPLFNGVRFRNVFLARALADRGHLAESYRIASASGLGDDLPLVGVGLLAPLGGVPPESASALYGRWLKNPPLREPPRGISFGFNVSVFSALPWWAAARDTTSIAAFGHVMDTLARSSNASMRPWLRYGSGSARAYMALARRDTTEALRRFLVLPDSVCPCTYDQIVTTQLLAARGRYSEAAAILDHQMPVVATGLWDLQRGRVFERLGRREEALKAYASVAERWGHADPELQPYVAEARAALQRLSKEPR